MFETVRRSEIFTNVLPGTTIDKAKEAALDAGKSIFLFNGRIYAITYTGVIIGTGMTRDDIINE